MKLTLILICGLGLLNSIAENTYAQTTKITLNFRDASVKDVLLYIEDNSEFSFMYDNNKIDVNRKVDIKVENETIDSILNQLFAKKQITTQVIGKHIIIIPEHYVAEKNTTILAQQQKSVNGKVTDASNLPLPGVTVIVKGTTQGTITDTDGTYSLVGISDNAVLQFSFVGMRTQEVAVGNQTRIDVRLEEELIGLEEVVAIGYGVQKKTTITGAISTVKGEELAKTPVPNISQSMAGKLAGVMMRPNGGQPGFDDPDIHIRGVVTTGDNKPLVVVDGVKRDNIRQIDPNSIESITILKDAAAVAPYGMGGANGVILITTKKGEKGKPVVRFSSSYGIQNPTYVPNMLHAKDYLTLQNEAYYNLTPGGTTPPNDPELIANYNQLHKDDPWRYADSDFTTLFKSNVPVQNYNIEMSGATESLSYSVSGGYYNQQGIFDKIDYTRYTYNVNLALQATPTTKVSVGLHGSVENTNELDATLQTDFLFRSMYKFIPTDMLMYPDGMHWGQSSNSSPVAILNSDGYNKTERNTLLTSLSIEQELPFVKGLSIKGVFSYDPNHINTKGYHIPFVYHLINYSTDPYSFTDAITSVEGQSEDYIWLEQGNQKNENFTYQGYVNYNRTFSDHSISGLFVAEARNSKQAWFNARRNNFAVLVDELSMGSSDKNNFDNGGSSSEGSEIGFVYRLGYSYKDKYMIEASGRYDGHYYFAPGERWGYFPSFSSAWRISEEDFMRKFANINNLKLRASWGKSGMLAGSPYQYQSGYDLLENSYVFGSNTIVQGAAVPHEANPNITWEVSNKYDIGLDLNMWNGVLNLEFDYFHEKRENMLLPPQVTLPVEYGLTLSQENKGEMNNRGFEIVVSSRKVLKNGMDLSVSANFSYAKNEMVEVFESDAERNNPNRTQVGRSYGTPFGYKTLGLFTTDDDKNGDGIIDSQDGYDVIQFGQLHPGDIKYADLSGPEGVPDGKIDSNDETVIGYPVYPRITYGITPSLKWKGFDLTLFFQGAAKSSINTYQFQLIPFENNGSNTSYEYFDNRWTPENQNAKYPRATTAPVANTNQTSDFWYKSTSYLRLKILTLGYTLPKRITDKLQISDVRFYVTGQNVFTISPLKHIDPEMGYVVSTSEGRELSYPVMKSTTFGVEINF